MPDVTAADVSAAVADHPEGATVRLRVVPRAPQTALVGRYGNALKLKVHAAPVGGAANAEVRRYLAERCRVRTAEVTLLRGERSRDKVALVRGRSAGEVGGALAPARDR